MLTINQLDSIKQNHSNLVRLERGHCSCGVTQSHIYAYIFGESGTVDVYWECKDCLKQDKYTYTHTKIVKLLPKEIFYLKI